MDEKNITTEDVELFRKQVNSFSKLLLDVLDLDDVVMLNTAREVMYDGVKVLACACIERLVDILDEN